MGLLGFQNRPVPGLNIVDFAGLKGTEPGRNPFKVVGREAPHHFKSILARLRAVWTPNIDDFRSGNRPILKTQQSHFLTCLVSVHLPLKGAFFGEVL